MNLEEIYREHYFFEINRKHQLTSQLGIPIGVLTILGGVIAFFVKSVQYIADVKWIMLAAIVLISMFFLGRTIYYLIRSYYGYTYRYIPTPKEIEKYREELVAYYEAEGTPEGDPGTEIKDFLLDRYAICTHENTINNDSKSAYFHKANTSLIFTLILVILCSIPYLLIKYSQPEAIQKIEIINFPSQKIGKERIMAEENQDQPQEQPQEQAPPKKPKRPGDRLVKEDTQPLEIREKED